MVLVPFITFALAEVLNHKTSVQKEATDFSEIILETFHMLRVISGRDNAVHGMRWTQE